MKHLGTKLCCGLVRVPKSSSALSFDRQGLPAGALLQVEKSIKFAKVKFSDWYQKHTVNPFLKKMENRSVFDPSQRISP